MIRDIHIAALRDMVEQTERDLAGYRYLLGVAEQGERAATVMPDPGMPAGAPWPSAWTPPAPPAPPVDGQQLPPHRVDPYPTGVLPQIDGSQLPPKQESALGAIASEHDAYKQSRDGVKEEQKWSSA